eukprot:3941710-Rhodomonas_salina.3
MISARKTHKCTDSLICSETLPTCVALLNFPSHKRAEIAVEECNAQRNVFPHEIRWHWHPQGPPPPPTAAGPNPGTTVTNLKPALKL